MYRRGTKPQRAIAASPPLVAAAAADDGAVLLASNSCRSPEEHIVDS